MSNQFIKMVLVISLSAFTILQAKSEYKDSYNNSTIDIPSSKNDKIFIREYKYNASDTDSKVSSRKKAIAQLKSILSEEVGVHITSSLEMKDTVKNGVNNKYFKSEISQLSASITKLKIIDEKWNGVTYYIKASVRVNEEQTMKLLLEAIKAKASKKDVKRLNKILKEQNGNLDKSYSKIQQLQKKLVLQEIQNQASKNELSEAKRTLEKLRKEKQKYDNKIIEHRSEINKIKRLVQKAKNRIKSQNKKACMIEKGMTKHEVIQAIGLPISTGGQCNYTTGIYSKYCEKWYYGDIMIYFPEDMNLVQSKNGCR